jgi:transcriptional regulator GlxA family with amidase domain
MEMLEENIGRADFHVDDLAEALGLSRRQLERRLMALAAETPAEMLRRIRLTRAAQLLKGGAGNVAEIAYAVGYRTPSHFSTAFRTAFGCSPSEYAREASAGHGIPT